MAVVKFISENDCRLFVDMDYVGDILANKMLKITLESGSYLVEIKDANDTILKKYELKISSEDAQVLQNIAFDSNSIEDSIDKLRDDPFIRFYNQRALFKHNDMNGYVNSQYKLVISPVYSYAEEFIQDRTLVKKRFPDKEMATIIDTDGNICFGQWFEYIGSDNNTILLKDNKRFIVITRNDYSIQNEYLDAGYDGKGQLIPVYREIGVDDMYGYIDKVGNEAIPLIYDYGWNFEDSGFAKVKRFGQFRAVDVYGNLYMGMPSSKNVEPNIRILTKEDSIWNDFGDYFDKEKPVKEGNYWGLGGTEISINKDGSQKIIKTNKINSYKCDKILYYEWNLRHIKIIAYRIDTICTLVVKDTITWKENCYTFEADSIEPIIEIEEKDYVPYECINMLVIKSNRRYGIIRINGETVLPSVYNSIVPNLSHEHTYDGQYDTEEISSYTIEKDSKYGIANQKGHIILPIEYDAIVPTTAQKKYYTGNYSILWKSGKCSLVDVSTGQVLFPFIYDDIIVNDTSDELFSIDSTFLVMKNGKYGFATFEKGQILDTIYDAISFKWWANEVAKAYYLIIQKDGKMGFYEYRFKYEYGECVFSSEPIYEKCVFLKNENAEADYYGMFFVAVKLNKKWGILDMKPGYSSIPNLEDLEFKYDSLKELKQDVDAEFKRRHNKKHR